MIGHFITGRFTGLCAAVGGIDADTLPAAVRDPMLKLLVVLYRFDPDPAGIVTLLLHVATEGLLHVTGSVRSDDAGDATVTVANEPVDPVVGFGLSVSDAGGCCGVSVSCVCTVCPFQVALIVTMVLLVTALVGIFRETD